MERILLERKQRFDHEALQYVGLVLQIVLGAIEAKRDRRRTADIPSLYLRQIKENINHVHGAGSAEPDRRRLTRPWLSVTR